MLSLVLHVLFSLSWLDLRPAACQATESSKGHEGIRHPSTPTALRPSSPCDTASLSLSMSRHTMRDAVIIELSEQHDDISLDTAMQHSRGSSRGLSEQAQTADTFVRAGLNVTCPEALAESVRLLQDHLEDLAHLNTPQAERRVFRQVTQLAAPHPLVPSSSRPLLASPFASPSPCACALCARDLPPRSSLASSCLFRCLLALPHTYCNNTALPAAASPSVIDHTSRCYHAAPLAAPIPTL